MKLDFLQAVSDEKKSLFCFSTVLILLLSLIYFGVVPLFEEAVLAQREYVKINEQVKTYEAFSKTGNYLQMEKEQLKKLETLEKRLPQNLQQADVMAELHSVAESSEVKLQALRQISKESTCSFESRLGRGLGAFATARDLNAFTSREMHAVFRRK